MGRRISRVRSSRLRVVVWISLALATLASACGSSGNRVNGPSFPVGDAGEPGGTLSADGGSDSGGGTVTDAGDAGDDAGTDPGPFPLGATLGHERGSLPGACRRGDRVLLDVYTTPQGADEVASFPMTQGGAEQRMGRGRSPRAARGARDHQRRLLRVPRVGAELARSTRRGRRAPAPGSSPTSTRSATDTTRTSSSSIRTRTRSRTTPSSPGRSRRRRTYTGPNDRATRRRARRPEVDRDAARHGERRGVTPDGAR